MGAMILFPAIDLKEGQCVRLKLGDMNEATVYNTDPARQALEIATRGFVLASGQNRFTDTGANLLADPDVAKSFLGG